VNVGYYSSSVNDANIERTHTAPTAAAEITALHTYENLLVKQLPVVWLPNGPYQLTMYKSDLKGFAPQGIFAEISPQYYSLSH
jgi:peptide/nickel transport system substrate-binding protein